MKSDASNAIANVTPNHHSLAVPEKMFRSPPTCPMLTTLTCPMLTTLFFSPSTSQSYPTNLNALRNPLSPSIVSLILAPELAELDRCRGLCRTCACGTSSRREELRLRVLTMMATSRGVGGADESDEDEDVLERVGASVVVVVVVVLGGCWSLCLCARTGY
jgi:hypothetical protein